MNWRHWYIRENRCRVSGSVAMAFPTPQLPATGVPAASPVMQAEAWTVHMDGGSWDALPKNGIALVWPVRGASSCFPRQGRLSVTIRPVYKSNAAVPARMVNCAWVSHGLPSDSHDNGNGTITDNLTGLIWPQNANPAMDALIARAGDGSLLWPDALEFVANLNSNCVSGLQRLAIAQP